MNKRTTTLGLCVVFWTAHAVAADAPRPSEGLPNEPVAPRESENDMFGGSAPSTPQEHPDAADANAMGPNATPGPGRDASELAIPHPERDAFASGEAIDNPLAIGGLYYQQLIVSKPRHTAFDLTKVDMPLQFDGFFDVRPNDRLRGFIDMRLMYDPARNSFGQATAGASVGSLQTASTSAAPTGAALTGSMYPDNPQAVLNEAWIKFDIERVLFVTAGKQHLKWGASRYWNPTDFLNPTKRDPLMPYDLRLGNTMIKIALPLEASLTNFYAVTMFENPNNASVVSQLGGAVRGETMLGNAELGVEVVWRKNYSPVLGADFSAPVGPFDIYIEGNCYLGPTPQLVELTGNPETEVTGNGNVAFTSLYKTHPGSAGSVQISGGTHVDFGWMENRMATVGVEYFYNQLGYTNPEVYPILMFLGQYLPFYTGRHYAAVYITAEGPDEYKHTTFTLSGMGNLSDESFIARMDFSWRLLTYLTFAAYADTHLGTEGGEFNFSLNTSNLQNVSYNGASIPVIYLPTTVFDVGMSLRLSF